MKKEVELLSTSPLGPLDPDAQWTKSGTSLPRTELGCLGDRKLFLDQQNLGFNPEFCAIFTRKKGGWRNKAGGLTRMGHATYGFPNEWKNSQLSASCFGVKTVRFWQIPSSLRHRWNLKTMGNKSEPMERFASSLGISLPPSWSLQLKDKFLHHPTASDADALPLGGYPKTAAGSIPVQTWLGMADFCAGSGTSCPGPPKNPVLGNSADLLWISPVFETARRSAATVFGWKPTNIQTGMAFWVGERTVGFYVFFAPQNLWRERSRKDHRQPQQFAQFAPADLRVIARQQQAFQNAQLQLQTLLHHCLNLCHLLGWLWVKVMRKSTSVSWGLKIHWINGCFCG